MVSLVAEVFILVLCVKGLILTALSPSTYIIHLLISEAPTIAERGSLSARNRLISDLYICLHGPLLLSLT